MMNNHRDTLYKRVIFYWKG